jgi:endonuclease/exonuclease/phosphatase family metal-dependent hydrolase
MTIRIVTYNIQYGIGLDGTYNLERIADAVSQADVIAFQEVTRGFIRNQGRDMVAEIEALFPDRFTACHMPTDIDFGSLVRDGKAVQTRFQFGNMIVSRWPITAMRGHLLPRSVRTSTLNLQRGALEALIATPAGPIRFYSMHLDHVDPEERLAQIAALRDVALSFLQTGGAVTGLGEFGYPEPPLSDDFLLLGDFNLEPGSPEYQAITAGRDTIIDVTASDPGWSWTDPAQQPSTKRLDYGFANPALAARISEARVDQTAEGSDHMPVWVQLDA